MADFHTVPVVDVSTENLTQIWPVLVSAMQSATFVAIDNVSTVSQDCRDVPSL